jgi:hypothetical protein
MCHQQMGLRVAKVEINEAVQEGKQKKSLREQSKSDLPFKGETHAKQWDQLIRTLLNWAGTTNDPFGTNEHPDLMERLQDLWNDFFEDIEIDIADHPAVKKKVVVSGCTIKLTALIDNSSCRPLIDSMNGEASSARGP